MGQATSDCCHSKLCANSLKDDLDIHRDIRKRKQHTESMLTEYEETEHTNIRNGELDKVQSTEDHLEPPTVLNPFLSPTARSNQRGNMQDTNYTYNSDDAWDADHADISVGDIEEKEMEQMKLMLEKEIARPSNDKEQEIKLPLMKEDIDTTHKRRNSVHRQSSIREMQKQLKAMQRRVSNSITAKETEDIDESIDDMDESVDDKEYSE